MLAANSWFMPRMFIRSKIDATLTLMARMGELWRLRAPCDCCDICDRPDSQLGIESMLCVVEDDLLKYQNLTLVCKLYQWHKTIGNLSYFFTLLKFKVFIFGKKPITRKRACMSCLIKRSKYLLVVMTDLDERLLTVMSHLKDWRRAAPTPDTNARSSTRRNPPIAVRYSTIFLATHLVTPGRIINSSSAAVFMFSKFF